MSHAYETLPSLADLPRSLYRNGPRLYHWDSGIGRVLMACLYSVGTGADQKWMCQRWDLPPTEVKLVAGAYIAVDMPECFTGTGPERMVDKEELSVFGQKKRQVFAGFVQEVKNRAERLKENIVVPKN